MKRWGWFLAMLLSVSVLAVPATQAADEVAGRNVYHTLKVEAMEVGDAPGHVVGVLQQTGLSFSTKGPAGGQTATMMATFSFDAVNGKGTFTGYTVTTFQDGSTLNYKSIGTMTPVDGGKKTTFDGTYEIVGGTGGFAGTKGRGTYKGERIGSPKTGGDSYIDFSGTAGK